MSRDTSLFPRLHEDVPFFKQAVSFTAVQTGLPPLLIEKDYFCTVLLARLAEKPGGLVFKGGTCLAKVLAGFYRLSEDLDFVIPLPIEAGRKERSAAVAPLKAALSGLAASFPVFEPPEPLVGANRSTQYIGAVRYRAPVSGRTERITIEVSLREPLLTPTATGFAKTVLLNPVTNKPLVVEVPFLCISLQEAFAEKVRAALSRREVAIRDFYDLVYAVKNLGLDTREEAFLALVRKKLDVPGNDPVDVSPRRFAELRKQVETRLKPVLRPADFDGFDLEEAFALAQEIAESLGPKL